ncbi:MAG TPA: SAM-dependent chlorinase/fluorinase [Nitrolancea sp.]|nr:SAM-dependent chlorinase/fluorinase [Nitrolancea sp.]
MSEASDQKGIVTLLSDFGLRDTYVGQMKGVMLNILPTAQIVDLTHEVAPQDVTEGAFQLATAWRSFPLRTVHVAVVDPGVGTSRRPIAFLYEGHFFVLPDNGLCSFVLGSNLPDIAVVLDRPVARLPTVTSTFHGRDLFSPAGAQLARGIALEELGSKIDPKSLIRLSFPVVEPGESVVRGPIVSIDHFGSCRTFIGPNDLPAPVDRVIVRCGRAVVRGIVRTYADVPEGRTLALFGSYGGLEISVRSGNAARAWELERGMTVEVTGSDDLRVTP